MFRYIEGEKIRAGYFGTEHHLRERKINGKERMAKMVPVSKRGKAKWVLEQYYRKMVLKLPQHNNLMKIKAAFLHQLSDKEESMYLCTVWKLYGENTLNLNEYLLSRNERLDDQAYKSLMIQLATAVEHLHSNGTAHNALTPFSVLVVEGTKGQAVVKVGDYGLTQVCGPAADDNYQPDGQLPKSLEFHLPPEAYDDGWGHPGQANTMADIFMLGLIFSAIGEHSVLEGKDKNEPAIIAAHVSFPGYGAVPIGRFIKTNPSMCLDRQIHRKLSPELRSLVRRMTLIDPEARPPANGVIHMLSACETIRHVGEEQASSSSSNNHKSTLLRRASSRKRAAAPAMFNPCASPPQMPRMCSASVIKPPSSTAGKTSLIRKASIRASNYLRRSRSVKISN
ncbi:serine/threonine-protein kinase 35-like [Diadema setosum]|uniref:serine/threonine-protein kinase 35-like n=1 Tax=Diadema setosum TaxID=31175 RepID=UPI003B3AD504